jgi:hypothetical protein
MLAMIDCQVYTAEVVPTSPHILVACGWHAYGMLGSKMLSWKEWLWALRYRLSAYQQQLTEKQHLVR